MEEKMISEMNHFFLYYFNRKNLDEYLIKENIENIINRLNSINFDNNKHKYLTLSCIFGAFLGDSIGSNCEFSYPSQKNYELIFKNIKGKFRPGEVTDDSEMAMSAAFAYIDANNEMDLRIQDLIYYYFCLWGASHPKDIGNTTVNALKFWNPNSNIKQTKFNRAIKEAINKQNWNSLSNGFLMRISTFIVFYYYTHYENIYIKIQNFFSHISYDNELNDELIYLYLDIFNESTKNIEVTHPNFENCISSAVFTLLVLTGMIRKNASDIYFLFRIISFSKKFIECHKSYLNIAQTVQKKYYTIIKEIESNTKFSVFENMGYYIHGFKLSIYYLYKYPKMGLINDNNLYYNIMCEICNLGGDTDTNCSIVGTIIGPLIGYKNFRSELFEKLIRFIPENRTQYNSAFMYIFVDYLEKKYLYKNKYETKGKNYYEKSEYHAYQLIKEFLTQKIQI